MLNNSNRLAWLRSALFWRTFFLLAFLITANLAAWVASLRLVESQPRAHQLAAQVISIVTITRAALTHSAPDMRRELLFDLASNEGVRIYPLEKTDIVERLPTSPLLRVLYTDVQTRLGKKTQFAAKVNEVAGFWISFNIDDDDYWLRLDRDRIEQFSSIQWLWWGGIALSLSLLGAVFISRLINQPLARLTSATRLIAQGKKPDPLPEKGPAEMREANRSFNQMVNDLTRVESDRAVILAGISHDLRTPLARMQLEVEMAPLPPEARQGMQIDLAQMDAIIAQFLDYARPVDATHFSRMSISTLMSDCAREAARLPDTRVQTSIAPHLEMQGNITDLQRVITNLIENSRRYGRTLATGLAEIDIVCKSEGDRVVIQIGDHGPGIPESHIVQMLQPFTRIDTARGQANGAGLGLAIVDHIVKRHNGKLRLSNRLEGGLTIECAFPSVRKNTSGPSLI